MSLQKLYDAVNTVAEKTANCDDYDKVPVLANGVVQLAQAYQYMKDLELHEKFHVSEPTEFSLPGEGPLNEKGSN